jgi:uncharacterized HAD superfamily protein
MIERPLCIGIDIDDVLFHSAKRSIELYNESYGTQLVLDDWYDFSDPESWPKRWGSGEHRLLVERVVKGVASDDFKTVEPIEGARQVLAHLKKEGHQLFAVTGRSHSVRAQTAHILDESYPGIFLDETLFFVDHFEHDGNKASKADVGLELKLTHFKEDLPDHANGLARVGIRTCLLDLGYKWNQHGVDDAVTRFTSWAQIGEFLDAEAARQ